MAALKAKDWKALTGPNRQPLGQEEATAEQRCRAERMLVDALLDISEESFLNELEPYEDQCFSGWEEAVRGWGRVAPLSCIFLPQRRDRKPKPKESNIQAPSTADPTACNGDSSARNAERRCEWQVDPQSSLEKPPPLAQQTGCGGDAAAAAAPPQPNAAERPVLSAMQKHISHLLLEEKLEKIKEEGALRGIHPQPHHLPTEKRLLKPERHIQRPNSTVVPIKNFTFLPPIKSSKLLSGKKAPEAESLEENYYVFDKKNGTKGLRVDTAANSELPIYTAALASKYRTCQHNHYLFSA